MYITLVNKYNYYNMKSMKLWMLAAILVVSGNTACLAQMEEPTVDAYFTTGEMPDMMKFLPTLPACPLL